MKNATLDSYADRLTRVLLHIRQHLDQPLSLNKLAEIACFSPYHFHRIFRGMTGESVRGHIRRLRLERAAHHLREGERTVIDVALDAGYESHEAFTRAFKSFSGFSPSRYRRDNNLVLPRLDHLRYGQCPVGYRFAPSFSKGEIMNVTLKQVDPIRVAYITHRGPYNQCGQVWDYFLPILGSQGLLGGDTQMIGLCHHDPDVTPPEDIRYDCCVSVDEHYQGEEGIAIQVIPGGTYAVTTHFGPYDKLGETYANLCGKWLPTQNQEPADAPAFEIYLTDPEGTDPEDLLTDIYMPIIDKGALS